MLTLFPSSVLTEIATQNVIMVGNPGTGKTHLSIGLGVAACRDGHRVRFYSAPALATELAEAQDKYQLPPSRAGDQQSGSFNH